MAEWIGGPPETVDWTTHAQTMDEVRELRAERDKALEQVETLGRALRPVAEMAERLKAKGHLDPEEGICGDPDLAFPVLDTPLSVTDLERIIAAMKKPYDCSAAVCKVLDAEDEQDKG